MSGSQIQPLHGGPFPQGRVAGQQYRCPPDQWPQLQVSAKVLDRVPTAGLWVPGSYASIWDLVMLSIPGDTQHDFTAQEMEAFLLVGAAQVNEHLGNRWPVPLCAWSQSVVFNNCELAYIGLSSKRGHNTEADYGEFLRREQRAITWCQSAQDRLITPDVRLSVEGLPTQAFKYVGARARGWDNPVGYLSGSPVSRDRRY